MTSTHSVSRIVLILVTCFVYIVMITFNGLAGRTGQEIGLFRNTTGEVSDVFYLDVTPAGWTFSIWGFIYTWQALWLVYGLSTICRKSKSGKHIYQLPVMSPWIYFLFIVNNFGNIGWLLVWDHQLIIWSLAVIAITPVTLYICLALSFMILYRNTPLLSIENAKKEAWLIRFLVQNGLAFYAAWVTVATLLNVAMVMIYKGDIANDIACTVILGLLSALIVVWFILDNTVLDKYVRYTFSPYITFTVALAGSVVKNFDLDSKFRNSVFLTALLSTNGLFLLLKIIVILVRHRTKPIDSHFEFQLPV